MYSDNYLQLCLTFFSDRNEEPTNTSTTTKFTSPTWSSTTSPIITHPCTIPCGPKVALHHTCLGIFQLFFTSSLLNLIADQTNLYAQQVLSSEAYDKFENVTPVEIQAYFGFMILMGINQLPCIYDYWKKDPIFHYSPIADKISRDRFVEITRFLHFTDNTSYTTPKTDLNYDRHWKIKTIMSTLSDSFLQVYNPHSSNCIDEAMIPFKGRSSLKQYIPNKPIKRGIKVWVRVDAVNGYVCQFEVYVG